MLFLATGGTFDKDYDAISGQLCFPKSCLSVLLTQANLNIDYRVEVAMQKDSLDMTIEDRQKIFHYCQTAQENKIIIIHGTDTMTETASFLSTMFTLTKRTIVLTGAMRPHAFGQSDAEFNLGFAVACVQTLPHGIYIAINGRVFSANSVEKNRQLGIFQPINAH